MLAAYMAHQQIEAVSAAEAERKSQGRGGDVPGRKELGRGNRGEE